MRGCPPPHLLWCKLPCVFRWHMRLVGDPSPPCVFQGSTPPSTSSSGCLAKNLYAMPCARMWPSLPWQSVNCWSCQVVAHRPVRQARELGATLLHTTHSAGCTTLVSSQASRMQGADDFGSCLPPQPYSGPTSWDLRFLCEEPELRTQDTRPAWVIHPGLPLSRDGVLPYPAH